MKSSKHLFKTALTAAGVLHCINKAIESSFSSNTQSKNSGKYYHWKHGDIFYKVSGNGAPLLLIHDLTVFSSNQEWSKVVNKLSLTNKVYCVDLPGCGKSIKPSITYTNYFYVQFITDFIHDIIGQSTSVAATGLSASFVVMANKLNNDLFNSITLINPTSISVLKQPPTDRSKLLVRLFELPIISKTLYYFLTNKENTEHYLTEKCFYNPFDIKPSLIKTFYDCAHSDHGNGRYLFRSLQSNCINADITSALANTNTEIQLITGAHKPGRKDLIDSYIKLNESITVKTIFNSNHLPQLECPEDFIEALH